MSVNLISGWTKPSSTSSVPFCSPLNQACFIQRRWSRHECKWRGRSYRTCEERRCWPTFCGATAFRESSEASALPPLVQFPVGLWPSHLSRSPKTSSWNTRKALAFQKLLVLASLTHSPAWSLTWFPASTSCPWMWWVLPCDTDLHNANFTSQFYEIELKLSEWETLFSWIFLHFKKLWVETEFLCFMRDSAFLWCCEWFCVCLLDLSEVDGAGSSWDNIL